MSDAPYAKALDGKLAEAQRAWRAPSVVAAVVRDGEVTWSGTVGVADLDGTPATADTSYRIGSITKTFTAVLVHQLRDAGLLDLDDPLSRWLPGSRHGALTLRRLLAHASGLQREPVDDPWVTLVPPTREDLLGGLERSEQVLPTRTSLHYSNLAFALLGEVVGQAAGSSWQEQLSVRLLEPLGLRRTTVEASAPRARGYFVDPWSQEARPEPDMDSGAIGPAMQLWSTLDDLARWGAFLADPDPAVLSVSTLDEMRQPVMALDPSTLNVLWGGGLTLERHGSRVLHGHGGAMPGFLAGLLAFRDPLERAAAVVLTNTGRDAATSGLAADLLTTALDADPRTPPAWQHRPLPEDLRPLVGPWWTEGVEVLFEHRDGDLTCLVRGGPEHRRVVLRPVADDHWVASGGAASGEHLRVERHADGTVRRLLFGGYAYTRDPRAFDELGRP